MSVLRPGGWFVNSDHIASDDPTLQTDNVSALREWQEQAFSQTKADTWSTFWQQLAGAVGIENTEAFRGVEGIWEGSEEGLPECWHIEALEQAGFTGVQVCWRQWGDAIVAARKP